MKVYKVGMIGFGSMGRTHSFAIESLPYFYRDLPFKASRVFLGDLAF